MPFEHPNPLLTAHQVSSATPGLPGSGMDFVNRAPTNLTAPVVSGTPEVGQELSTTNGTWDAYPAVSGYAYQWLQDSVEIESATAAAYTLVEGDVDTNISCEVTATNSFGSTPAVSNEVGPVTEVVEP